MYCVVETVEDREKNCTAVPKCWVRGNILLWPVKKYDAIKGRKKCLPPNDNWTEMQCKILFDNITDWEEAVEKEQMSEFMSSSEADEIVQLPPQTNIISKAITLSTVNFNDLMNSINNEAIVFSPFIEENSNLPDNTSQNLPLISSSGFTSSCVAENVVLPENTIQNLPLSSCLVGNLEIESLRNEVKELKAELQKHDAKMEVLLNLILAKIVPKENKETDDYLFKEFPIKISGELENLEKKLRSDAGCKSSLAQKLSKFGGTDGIKTARTIAKFLFTDEVLVDYSWGGTAKKKNFSSFIEINELIANTVRKLFSKFTACDNANFFNEHLKHAKTRLGRCSRHIESSDHEHPSDVTEKNDLNNNN